MRKELSNGNGKLVYDVYGEGQPVLLVHGFGETRTVWKHQVETLSQQFKLYVPDLPGSGDSDLQADSSMEGMAATLKTLVDKENIEPFMLVGHSMGGYISLAFAEKYPEMLSSLTLLHSSAFADSAEKKETREKGIVFIENNGASAFLKNTSPKLFSDHTKEKHPELVDRFIDTLSSFTDQSLIAYYKGMIARPDRTAILKEATFPIHFIAGKHDTAIPLDDMLKQSTLPPISSIDIMKESGHMSMLEEPRKCTEVLTKVLSGTDH